MKTHTSHMHVQAMYSTMLITCEAYVQLILIVYDMVKLSMHIIIASYTNEFENRIIIIITQTVATVKIHIINLE